MGLSAATLSRLDGQLDQAVEQQRTRDFEHCYDALAAACGPTMPSHHTHGGGGGGGNVSACFACAAEHNATVGVNNCTTDDIGELCVPHHHHYQPPCNCSAEVVTYATALRSDSDQLGRVTDLEFTSCTTTVWYLESTCRRTKLRALTRTVCSQATTRRCTLAWRLRLTLLASASGTRHRLRVSACTARR